METNLGNEPEYVHCSVCGFMCKIGRDALSNRGEGTVVGETTTNGTITAGDNFITVVSTTTFDGSGMAFVYSSDKKSRDMFTFTGKTSTTFTGIPTTGKYAIKTHSDTGLIVCDCNAKVRRGCPCCGSMNYLAGERKVTI